MLAIGSTTDLGLVLAAGGVPFALFAIAGGVVSDRIGRRNVMLASDLLRVVVQTTTGVLLVTGAAQVWMLAVLSFVYGLSAAAFMPALIGLIPQTVQLDRLQEANALIALSRSIANVGGPALAGVLIAISGPGEAIAIDALTFVVSAACLALLRLRPGAVTGARPEEPGFLSQLREGWREVRSRPWLRWGLLAMAAYQAFVLPAVLVLGPTLAERDLGGASSWAVIVACWGAGSILGNVVAIRLPVHRPTFVAALALVGASLQGVILGSGLGTAGIAAAQVLAGACVSLFFTLWDTSIQEQVPPQRGLARLLLRLRRVDGPDAGRHGGRRPALGRPRAADDAAGDGRGGRAQRARLAGSAERSAPAPSRARHRRGRRPGRAERRADGRGLAVPVVGAGLWPARAIQAHLALDALDPAPPGRRPAELLAHRVAHLPGGEHRARAGDGGDPAGEVDRPAVPVAGAAERLAARDPDPQLGEGLALAVGGGHEVEADAEQLARLGRRQHRRVADRLDQADVAAQHVAGQLGEAVGDAAELVGRHLLAEAREADEVGEGDRRPRGRRAATPPGARRR